jgi:hypothetical protein
MPTALKTFYRRRQHRLKCFNAVADSGKKFEALSATAFEIFKRRRRRRLKISQRT